MKRKEKKEEYTGLFHNADDYGIYHMTAQQRILGFVVGMFAGACCVPDLFWTVDIQYYCGSRMWNSRDSGL